MIKTIVGCTAILAAVILTIVSTWYSAESTWNRCRDTDGENTEKKGTVRFGEQRFIDTCTLEGTSVLEFHCRSGKRVTFAQQPCPGGCREGACLLPIKEIEEVAEGPDAVPAEGPAEGAEWEEIKEEEEIKEVEKEVEEVEEVEEIPLPSITIESPPSAEPGQVITMRITVENTVGEPIPSPVLTHAIAEAGFVWKNVSFEPAEFSGTCGYDRLRKDIVCQLPTITPGTALTTILEYSILPGTLCPSTIHHTAILPVGTPSVAVIARRTVELTCPHGWRPLTKRYCCSLGALCQPTTELLCPDGVPSMETLALCNALCTTKGAEFLGEEVILGTWSPVLRWSNVQTGDLNGDGRDDILGRTMEGNELWVGRMEGNSIQNKQFGTLQTPPYDMQVGDFNGDGTVDLATLTTSLLDNRQYSFLLSNGETFSQKIQSPQWGMDWVRNITKLRIGDIQGDGRDDILLQTKENDLWISTLEERTMKTKQIGALFPLPWDYTFMGDTDGNGTSDLIARTTSGEWYVAMLRGEQLQFSRFLQWPEGLTWTEILIGDFNGDRKTDIAGKVGKTREWWVGISDGSTFRKERWGAWPQEGVDTDDIRVGDFNGDGKDDMIGRRKGSGIWAVGLSDGSAFAEQEWGRWEGKGPWVDILVGDFNGDELDDIVGRVETTGEWHALLTIPTAPH